uniref:VWFA domain-containing protein n=1 Tax=Trichogramma kaykai TaxID=54128 RepID=A0ABD2X032_9HYME
MWSHFKKISLSPEELEKNTEAEIKNLIIKAASNKALLTCYFANAAKKSSPATITAEIKNTNEEKLDKVYSDSASISHKECSKKFKTPAQDQCQEKINKMTEELNAVNVIQNSPLFTENVKKRKIEIENELNNEKNKWKKLQGNLTSQSKARQVKKARLEDVCNKNPELSKALKVREASGRPRLEEKCPELIQTIIDIVSFSSGADPRRRSEMIQTCKTLEQLTDELQKRLNLNLSRSATYLPLLPHRINSTEGKMHVNTAPVKLDDKTRIALGVTAAKSQTPILMNMQYRVTLPDHDWVKAEKHKLIPSVYAGITINSNGMGSPEAVTCSGPTVVRVRSAKHSSSYAASHAADMKYILDNESFAPLGFIKPVIIISTDGGPDENPRYAKVIHYARQHFIENDLDAVFIMTNAPGRSAYNKVERRMAPLSFQLSGVLLKHDYYGSHLNSQGKTTNIDLEKKKF